MLAYVFSHRAAGGVSPTVYEESLRRFHTALASAMPQGFIASTTLRIGGAFSDWYLLDDSAALDVLNAAAVSGERSAPHDAAAGMAADGVGKLLKLAAGDHSLAASSLAAGSLAAGFEVRFAKPAGMRYADLYERLQAWTVLPGVSLWRRMMVLGPPPEFCLATPSEVTLPAEMRPEVLRRTRI